MNVTTGSRDSADIEKELAERVAKLSPGQLDCLRLVKEQLSSKEIAAELKVSSHTVDQRIRGALQILGVERRAPDPRRRAPRPGRAYRRAALRAISAIDKSIAAH